MMSNYDVEYDIIYDVAYDVVHDIVYDVIYDGIYDVVCDVDFKIETYRRLVANKHHLYPYLQILAIKIHQSWFDSAIHLPKQPLQFHFQKNKTQ